MSATAEATTPHPAEPWRRNEAVTVAMVFVVFTGFAFVLPFLPLYVSELGVRRPEDVAIWAGVLIGIAPGLAGLLGRGIRSSRLRGHNRPSARGRGSAGFPRG